jgi:hypothetical protein
MDAITLLKEDHRTVAGLFARFEAAGDQAYETKRSIVERIIEELSVHAAIEELVFYPQTRNDVTGVEDMALESLEEHHIVKWLLSELEGMDPREERFDAKVTVLIENVRHHVEEEESDYFPKVRDQLNRGRLMDMGEQLAKAKKTVPTRPHPRMPDTPPGNIVAGAATGLVDKATDAVKGAVSDAFSIVTRSGSDAVEQVEDKASDVKDAAERTARKATATTKRNARKATTTAKRTAKTATATTKRTAKKATAKATSTGRTKPKAKKASSSKPAKRATTRATGPTRRTAKRATSTAKRTAKKAPATAKKATAATRRTATKATAGR